MTDDPEPDDDLDGHLHHDKNIYDPDTHQIAGTTATPQERSEHGRALAALGGERNTKKLAAKADDLLREMGYDDPSQANPSDRLLAEKAAKENIKALEVLLSQAGKLVRAARTSASGSDAKWDGRERRQTWQGLVKAPEARYRIIQLSHQSTGAIIARVEAYVRQGLSPADAYEGVEQEDEQRHESERARSYVTAKPSL